MNKVTTQLEHFKTQLRAVGLKATPSRLAILALLAKTPAPLSIPDIAAKLKQRAADPATLYRTMHSFVAAGLVRIVDLRQPQAYYELASDHHHHHIVCEQCHTVVDLPHCAIDTYETEAKKKSGFAKITSHALELFGVCKRCAS